MICHLLKLTNSVRVVFVPGSENLIEMKTANWNITQISQTGMSIQLTFKSPIHISKDDLVDQLRISFHNTQYYLNPVDSNKEIILNGFTLIQGLPPQAEEVPIVPLENVKTFSLTTIIL